MIAGKSAISTVGLGYGLNYRGYNIDELADKSTFEEVAYLLLIGELPTSEQLTRFRRELNSYRRVDPVLLSILEKIPRDAHPMDVMRCVSSFMGVIHPEGKEHS
jgi:2-methylcitrate synthase